jgi:hypothetical protein
LALRDTSLVGWPWMLREHNSGAAAGAHISHCEGVFHPVGHFKNIIAEVAWKPNTRALALRDTSVVGWPWMLHAAQQRGGSGHTFHIVKESFIPLATSKDHSRSAGVVLDAARREEHNSGAAVGTCHSS